MVFAPPRWKLTADEYQRMGEVGIFHEDDRVELLDGELYAMTPIGDDHIGAVNDLTASFARRLGDRGIVSPQNPIRLDDHSEPQPDLTLLRPREDRYRRSRARPEDVLLVIEVARSSLDYDRATKLPRYAAAGIPAAWIINLVDEGGARRPGRLSDHPGRLQSARRQGAGRGEGIWSVPVPHLRAAAESVGCRGHANRRHRA